MNCAHWPHSAMLQIPRYNKRNSLLCLTHVEAPTPQNRVVFSVLTFFSSTNGALCSVKETGEDNASHVDLTWHCGKSFVTASVVLHCV